MGAGSPVPFRHPGSRRFDQGNKENDSSGRDLRRLLCRIHSYLGKTHIESFVARPLTSKTALSYVPMAVEAAEPDP